LNFQQFLIKNADHVFQKPMRPGSEMKTAGTIIRREESLISAFAPEPASAVFFVACRSGITNIPLKEIKHFHVRLTAGHFSQVPARVLI
jgi:hypothetical protein